jgi:NAD(P)-dependent dehydrogenase (short-subunit alcohol dehydrogenase family)
MYFCIYLLFRKERSMTNQTAFTDLPDVGELFRLNDRIAVVTGAGNGIGRLAAQALAQAGASVVLADLDQPAAAQAAAEISDAGYRAEARLLDVTDETNLIAMFADVARSHGRIDILVNSAGAARRMATEDTPLEVWNQILAVNLTGVFLCCREAGKQMLKQRSGSIINISSIMGHRGGGIYPNPSYHASKGAIVNLTRALAAEWADRGVRVNDIAPTFVNTRFITGLMADEKTRSAIEARTPLGRVAEVGDLAGAFVYLASPAAAMVTGHSLAVDGGWLAR